LSTSGAVPNPPAAAYCKRPPTDSVEPFLIPICLQVQSLSFTRSERFTSSTSCHLPDMYLATWLLSTDMFNPYGSILRVVHSLWPITLQAETPWGFARAAAPLRYYSNCFIGQG